MVYWISGQELDEVSRTCPSFQDFTVKRCSRVLQRRIYLVSALEKAPVTAAIETFEALFYKNKQWKSIGKNSSVRSKVENKDCRDSCDEYASRGSGRSRFTDEEQLENIRSVTLVEFCFVSAMIAFRKDSKSGGTWDSIAQSYFKLWSSAKNPHWWYGS